jgi:hypothetical protein
MSAFEAEMAVLIGKALEAGIEQAAKQYGPGLLKRFQDWTAELRKADHPSLAELREICDCLERFAVKTETRAAGLYQFPPSSDAAPFRRNDLTAVEVAELWFRTDTPQWRERIQGVAERWETISGTQRQPYFSGEARLKFDYGSERIPAAVRHPILKNLHPFIMLSRVPREKLGADPVGEVLDLFLAGWKVFTEPDYVEFRRGTALFVGDQAYAAGTFTIPDKSPFLWSNTGKLMHEDVHLWRCVMVTARATNVDILNVGIPASVLGGIDYFRHFADWMKGFKVLNAG